MECLLFLFLFFFWLLLLLFPTHLYCTPSLIVSNSPHLPTLLPLLYYISPPPPKKEKNPQKSKIDKENLRDIRSFFFLLLVFFFHLRGKAFCGLREPPTRAQHSRVQYSHSLLLFLSLPFPFLCLLVLL